MLRVAVAALCLLAVRAADGGGSASSSSGSDVDDGFARTTELSAGRAKKAERRTSARGGTEMKMANGILSSLRVPLCAWQGPHDGCDRRPSGGDSVVLQAPEAEDHVVQELLLRVTGAHGLGEVCRCRCVTPRLRQQ